MAALTVAAVTLAGGFPALEAAHAAACPAGMASIFGRFCIDRYEASLDVVTAKGSTVRRHSPHHTPSPDTLIRARSRPNVVPQAYLSMHQARAACEAAGKRLCTDAEWVTACKGRQPTLYPYGPAHQLGRCNDEGRSPLLRLHGAEEGPATFGYEAMNDPRLNQLPDTVARTGQFARCRNSFGLFDMVGNLHEWTAEPQGTFRGGYYLDTHQHGQGCEYQTTGHAPEYHDYSIGFRCCTSLVAGKTVVMPPRSGSGATPPRERLRAGEQWVEIESGDTLSGLAQRHEVTVAAICERNHISREAPLRPGQRLVMPPARRQRRGP